MGCCCSSLPETEVVQLRSQSELPSYNPKTKAAPRSFSNKIEKNYSRDINGTETALKDPQENNKATTSTQATEEPSEPSENGYDLDASEREQHRREHQQKMADKQHEIAQDQKRIQELNDKAFDEQVTRQRSKTFVGLYQIFEQYSTNKTMDIDGVTEALAHFGIIINTFGKTFQKLIFSKFDIGNEGAVDYNDFSATMSWFIGRKDEDSLLIMFQCFDLDEDGYLNLEDMARLLLAQNHIAVIITGQQNTKTNITYNKRQCLKLARKMISKYDNDRCNDNKISFDEFAIMMKNLNEEDMMIDNMSMVTPSVINLSNININGMIINTNNIPYSSPTKSSNTPNLSPNYTPNQSDMNTPKIDT